MLYNDESKLMYSKSVNSNIYTIYDKSGNKMYDLDFSDYDTKYIILELINEKYIIATIGQNKIYFDYKTGELITSPIIDYEIGDIKLEYDCNDTLKIKTPTEEKEIKMPYDLLTSYKKRDDGTITIVNDKEMYVVKKVN